MALLSLLFQSLRGGRAQIGLVRLDAVIRETHQRTSVITDHPIEGGSTIQDHIIRNPERLSMEGLITDTPLTGGTLGVNTAFDLLDLTWRSGIPFTVVSGLKVYPLMAFESLDMPRVRASSMQFTATLKQITITLGQTVTVDGGDAALTPDNVESAPAQANQVDAGRQPAPPASPAVQSAVDAGGAGVVPAPTRGKSFAKQLFEGDLF